MDRGQFIFFFSPKNFVVKNFCFALTLPCPRRSCTISHPPRFVFVYLYPSRDRSSFCRTTDDTCRWSSRADDFYSRRSETSAAASRSTHFRRLDDGEPEVIAVVHTVRHLPRAWIPARILLERSHLAFPTQRAMHPRRFRSITTR